MMKFKIVILMLGLLVSNSSYSQKGIASFYGIGDKTQGRKTACGDKFNTYTLVAAHRTLPCGTKVRVTNLNNNESVIVTIRDRGPAKRLKRLIDLSFAAKNSIKMGGLALVSVQPLN